jgi:hypothetical protein
LRQPGRRTFKANFSGACDLRPYIFSDFAGNARSARAFAESL